VPRIGERVTSLRNPLVARFRRVGAGKDREEFLLEGVRILEVLLDGPPASLERIEAVLVSPRLEATDRGRALRERLEGGGLPLHPATDAVLERATEAKAHQGVVALARTPPPDREGIFVREARTLLLVADGVQDPGNVGALLRIADASGAAGAIVTSGSAFPFGARAVRASAGAAWTLPVLYGVAPGETARLLRQRGVRIVVADASGGEDDARADLRPPVALVFGSEGAGASRELRDAASFRVSIPLRGAVESLNVAAAAAVLAFRAARAEGSREAR
jgi:TrmH family RNA methyltransferase